MSETDSVHTGMVEELSSQFPGMRSMNTNRIGIDTQERNLCWNLIRQQNGQMYIMHDSTGERGNASMPTSWVRPGRENGAILLQGVMRVEG